MQVRYASPERNSLMVNCHLASIAANAQRSTSGAGVSILARSVLHHGRAMQSVAVTNAGTPRNVADWALALDHVTTAHASFTAAGNAS